MPNKAGTFGSSGLLDLKILWDDLISGRTRLLGSLYWGERCFVTIEHCDGEHDRRLRPRRIAVLKQLLLGRRQKEVAYDFGFAVSTVAVVSSECLRAMSKSHLASRVPSIVVMAAHAAQGVPQAPAYVYTTGTDSNRYSILSVERLDRELPATLSPAEARVIRLLVEGHSHREMATLRGASPRTVANQLAAAFKKLGISGRSELLAMLTQQASVRSIAPPPVPTPPPPPPPAEAWPLAMVP